MKIIKKVTALLLVAVMTFALGSVVFAADSKEGTGVVTDAKGAALEGLKDATPALTLPEAEKILEESGKTGYKGDAIIWQKDIPSTYKGQALTFKAPATSALIALYHYDGSKWGIVATAENAASITHSFSDLSPVAFVSFTKSSASDGSDSKQGGKSPVTGVSDFVVPAAAIFVLALAGSAIIVSKRERQ